MGGLGAGGDRTRRIRWGGGRKIELREGMQGERNNIFENQS